MECDGGIRRNLCVDVVSLSGTDGAMKIKVVARPDNIGRSSTLQQAPS